METIEPDAQSFIVKIWVEDDSGRDGQAIWHGHITHVPSRQRRYLNHLSEIQDFIAPRLEEMGGLPDTGWRIRRWLKRLAGRS